MRDINPWLEGIYLWPKAVGRAWPWLIFAVASEELVSYFMEAIKNMSDGYMLMGMMITLAVQLIFSALSVVIINQIAFDARKGVRTSLWNSLQDNIKYIFIE